MPCKMQLWSLNTIHKPFSLPSSSRKTLTTRPVTMHLRATNEASGAGFRHLKMRTLDGCKIHISKYWLAYDGQGGEGAARARSNGHESGVVPISFDFETFRIPPLTSTTAKVFGLVFPPFVTVHIHPDLFQGCIDIESGQVDLQFRGKIWFHVGGYKPPPLLLDTLLTSEESEGAVSGTKRAGERIGGDGKCRLVGVATVDPVDGEPTMNSLLGLPTECVTDLRAAISFF